MQRPKTDFTYADMLALVRAVSGMHDISDQGDTITIRAQGAFLALHHNVATTVVVESDEIAEHYGLPCRKCATRWEMNGDDPDMVLFNDFLIVNEKVEATGKFVLFDPVEGKAFGDQG